jgi:hypothetical protein
MDLVSILKSIAPGLATAVAGPLGGAAVKVIADKLGVPSRLRTSPEERACNLEQAAQQAQQLAQQNPEAAAEVIGNMQ